MTDTNLINLSQTSIHLGKVIFHGNVYISLTLALIIIIVKFKYVFKVALKIPIK